MDKIDVTKVLEILSIIYSRKYGVEITFKPTK